MGTLTRMVAEAAAAHPDVLLFRFCERRNEVAELRLPQALGLGLPLGDGPRRARRPPGRPGGPGAAQLRGLRRRLLRDAARRRHPGRPPAHEDLRSRSPHRCFSRNPDRLCRRPRPGAAQDPGRSRGLLPPAGVAGPAVVTGLDLPENANVFAPDQRTNEVALFQFTSGTAGPTKVVELTHSALMAQVSGIYKALALDPENDSAVSWLPLFHDMGLIGFLLTSVFSGCPVTLLRTEDFAVRPGLWVQALSDARATITGGPRRPGPCAPDACRESGIRGPRPQWTPRRPRRGRDGQPLQPRKFHGEVRAPRGFRPTSLMPTYGLAENGLAVTIPPLDRGARFDRVDLDQFEEGGVAASAVGADTRGRAFASVGCPLPGVEVAVVDEEGHRLEDTRVGEIAVSGPTVMKGYLHQPEITREAIRDGWLRTGDLGYLKDGELYITGRRKEVLIVGGRNYYPEDLGVGRDEGRRGPSWKAGRGLRRRDRVGDRKGRDSGRDRSDRQRRDATACVVRSDLHSVRRAFPVDRVVLLPRRSIRSTPNGKLMRLEARARYLAGRLGEEVSRGS